MMRQQLMFAVGLALIATTAAAQAPALPATTSIAPAAAAPKERMVCRREIVTGSLVRSAKKCMKASDWDRVADVAQENSHDLVGRNRAQSNGGP